MKTDSLNQSLLVDEEFNDKNLFTHYKGIIKSQVHNIKPYHLNTYQLKSLEQPIINNTEQQQIINYELKTQPSISFNKKIIALRSSSVKREYKTKNFLTEQSHFQNRQVTLPQILHKLKPILNKEKPVNPFSQAIRQLKNCAPVSPLMIESLKNPQYERKIPKSCRYNDTQLNQYLEELKIGRQVTINSVIVPQISKINNRFNQTQISQKTQQNNYNQSTNKIKPRQNLIDVRKTNQSLSGWSDHSIN